MNISDITSYLDAVEQNRSLFCETAFDERMEVIDFLGFEVMDSLAAHPLPAVRRRAEEIKSQLERIDQQLFERLRATIRTEGCTGAAFKELILQYVTVEHPHNHPGYDNLDIFINGLSPLQMMPEPVKDLEPEMVYFQKTPARVVFELVEQARFVKEDVFFDLGAGLGQVAILVHLLAGINTRGVEFEPAFCDYARHCATALQLSNVAFVNADARQANYSEGTVFFMFTPFTGDILEEVLEIIRKESLSRKIKIITYGPCTAQVTLHNWLQCVTPRDKNMYKLAVFHSF